MNDNDKENEATTGKCAECGGETPARDTHQCAACHVTLCESCVETCHDCGVGLCHGCYEECQCAETLCHDCALPCSACGRMLLCSDCAVRCDVCDDPLCSDCEYRCEDCDCALCYECVYDLDGDYAYCSDCWNSRRQEPYYADSPCWLKMQEHKHMLTIGLEIEINGAHGQSRLKESPLIAGWCTDLSLDDEGRESSPARTSTPSTDSCAESTPNQGNPTRLAGTCTCAARAARPPAAGTGRSRDCPTSRHATSTCATPPTTDGAS